MQSCDVQNFDNGFLASFLTVHVGKDDSGVCVSREYNVESIDRKTRAAPESEILHSCKTQRSLFR